MMSDSISILSVNTVRAESEVGASRAQHPTADPAFADTLARCATPLFPPWTLTAPIRIENTRTTESPLSAHATDPRRDRRQRSRVAPSRTHHKI